ncbi:MAG TPA: hypothetical protein VIU62_14215, partial [Chloroflexota bacterium]
VHSPLFGAPATLEPAEELARLLTTHTTSVSVLGVLQERRAQRLEMLRRRDKLLHFPFRMPVLLDALGAPPTGAMDAGWPSSVLREGIADLHAAHRSRVAAAGEPLLAQGRDDLLVLETLEGEWPVFKRAARADLEHWARETRLRLLAVAN